MIKEFKKYLYACDDCKEQIILSDVIEGTLPDGWQKIIIETIQDGYGSYFPAYGADLGNILIPAVHNCAKCYEKREIKEVFM